MQTVTMSPKPKPKRKLSQEWKIGARTAPEIYEQFYSFVAKMASHAGVKFRGRKLGREATLNAIVLHFFDQAEAEQARVLREYVPRYESILGDESAPTHLGHPIVPITVQTIEPGAEAKAKAPGDDSTPERDGGGQVG